ncbi:hypothetical protein B0T25DRAFT_459110 [Lasiosphaeria hispida]|uniref:Uncharacterized protein n=1 Tax=Lasiosphaeria hispida TaxID=260671 RepID=A0AAJ0MD73_9PEZI|nr:hypothetical protein B0T25DRAFT_459110 [Lasiosphaeria hispida]
MVAKQSLRQLAVAVLLQCRPGLALPQGTEVIQLPPSPWVTVDTAGGAFTYTPRIFTNNGALTTQFPVPDSLTASATYTISPGGRPSTYTGLAPVATATGASDAGSFLACQIYQGADAPFCQPRRGALLSPGQTYYVTWSLTHFADPSTLVEVQGTYENGEGFSSGMRVMASTGFYAWEIPADFLSSRKRSSLNVTLYLAQDDASTPAQNDITPIKGPTVFITDGTSFRSHHVPNPVVIAVPVVLAVAVLLLGGFCFWSWRRHGTVPVVGALGKKMQRRSSGYGVRKSHAERTGAAPGVGAGGLGGAGGVNSDKPNVGIQLTDRDSWSPTGTGNSRNVFREELQRQAMDR